MATQSTQTILTIDDKPANIFALEKLLERSDRVFLNATTGKEGLRLALDYEIDLIILDVQMPEMDGFEVAQILKSHKRTKDIPLLFASAEKKEREFMMKGFEEGAVDYLSKPLDPEVTKAKVSVLLQLQLQKKELIEKNLSLERADAQIKELNTELQKNVYQLEAVNKELESFSYSVSHDLRAPLRIVSGQTGILLEDYEDQLDEAAKRLLHGIRNNVTRMNTLIDDLLKFSKLGRKELQKAVIQTDKLVHEILEELSKSSPHHAQINIGPLPPAHADYTLLTQVWVNLLSNAIKYSSKKETPRVDISCERQGNTLVYAVKDNGAGFSMDYADKLFGVFQRLHAPTEFEGTGVGLAIVQRIVTKHGGKVWAEGRENEGATFYFSLPA
jgi:two-component system, sensor histidine kinase and response regulator